MGEFTLVVIMWITMMVPYQFIPVTVAHVDIGSRNGFHLPAID